MSRGLLKVCSATITVLTLLMSVIIVFPYSDDLLPLAAEMDCVKLCFLDIRPGVTQLDDALEQLSSSNWVTNIQIDTVSQLVRWDWTGQQPFAIDTTLQSVIEYHEDVVLRIHLITRIPLGEVVLRWANLQRQPNISAIGRTNNFRLVRTAFYLGNGYVAAVNLNCHDFWRSSTALILGANLRFISGFGRTRFEVLRFKRSLSRNCI